MLSRRAALAGALAVAAPVSAQGQRTTSAHRIGVLALERPQAERPEGRLGRMRLEWGTRRGHGEVLILRARVWPVGPLTRANVNVSPGFGSAAASAC